MATRKQSFLSNLIGKNTYDGMLEYAKPIVICGTCVWIVLFVLSYFFYLEVISYMVSLVNGTSLLFMAYVVEAILLLDRQVDQEIPEPNSWKEPQKIAKCKAYKLTVVWGGVLAAMGVAAIYFTNRYRDQYSFECDTFLVDHNAKIYHYDWNDDCEKAEEAESLEEMKGYQIDKRYSLCEWCKETREDAEEE